MAWRSPQKIAQISVIAGQAQEASQFFNIGGGRPIDNCRHLALISGYAFCTNHMAQVSDFSLSKRAFGELNMPLICSQELKNCSEMLHMFCEGLTVNQYVVEEH